MGRTLTCGSGFTQQKCSHQCSMFAWMAKVDRKKGKEGDELVLLIGRVGGFDGGGRGGGRSCGD